MNGRQKKKKFRKFILACEGISEKKRRGEKRKYRVEKRL